MSLFDKTRSLSYELVATTDSKILELDSIIADL